MYFDKIKMTEEKKDKFKFVKKMFGFSECSCSTEENEVEEKKEDDKKPCCNKKC